jgi:hypothetical protein
VGRRVPAVVGHGLPATVDTAKHVRVDHVRHVRALAKIVHRATGAPTRRSFSLRPSARSSRPSVPFCRLSSTLSPVGVSRVSRR